MELHLPGQQSSLAPMQSTRFKPRTKNTAAPSQARGGGNKFVGVRQRPSGRWVAEIKDTTQKIRMWLGTFESAEDAARAYDEAACLLRGANTRTNFSTRRPSVSSDAGVSDSPIATRIRKLLHHKKLAGEHSNHHRNPSFFPPSAVSDGGSGGGSPTSSTSTTTEFSGSKQGSPSASDHYQEVYRPYFAPEFELGSSVSESSSSAWAFDLMFEGFELSKSVDFPDFTAASSAVGSNPTADVTEFERMTVERQISASLYAMNGVQEYFEAVQDLSSSTSTAALLVDPVWDLPPLYHFY